MAELSADDMFSRAASSFSSIKIFSDIRCPFAVARLNSMLSIVAGFAQSDKKCHVTKGHVLPFCPQNRTTDPPGSRSGELGQYFRCLHSDVNYGPLATIPNFTAASTKLPVPFYLVNVFSVYFLSLFDDSKTARPQLSRLRL